jgi:hypothetical protein
MASRIECITKPQPHNTHEAITHVGGVRANGTSFYITRIQCATDIRTGSDSYYVHVGNLQIGVEAYQKNGGWYIRTKPDHSQRDNLLNLPQCR